MDNSEMVTIKSHDVKMVIYQGQVTFCDNTSNDSKDVMFDLEEGVLRVNGFTLTPAMKVNFLAYLNEQI